MGNAPYDPNSPEELAKLRAWFDLFAQFGAEGDRAAIILGVARLDELLEQALKAFMLPGPKKGDSLLGGEDNPDAPLGTLSARTRAAERLGFIAPEIAKALDVLRKIRNKVAHRSRLCSLDESPFRDLIQHLVQQWPKGKKGKTMIDDLIGPLAAMSPTQSPGALRVFAAIGLLVPALERLVETVERVKLHPIRLAPGK